MQKIHELTITRSNNAKEPAMHSEAKTYSADRRKPEMNIEMLPIQLLFSLNGSFAEPYLLPTMSAKPSPPLIIDNETIPIGDWRQKTKTLTSSTMT
jgi:hypothetical protein